MVVREKASRSRPQEIYFSQVEEKYLWYFSASRYKSCIFLCHKTNLKNIEHLIHFSVLWMTSISINIKLFPEVIHIFYLDSIFFDCPQIVETKTSHLLMIHFKYLSLIWHVYLDSESNSHWVCWQKRSQNDISFSNDKDAEQTMK